MVLNGVLDGQGYHVRRAIAIPDLEAAIRALRLNRLRNLQDDVGLRKPRSSFRCRANEAG